MSASNGSAIPQEASEIVDKGKGKSVDPTAGHDMMEEDDEDSEEESGVEDVAEPEEEDDDNMEEIDTNNIVGRRTRGKTIDWAEADKKLQEDGDVDEDDEEDEDEDFEDPEDDKMEE